MAKIEQVTVTLPEDLLREIDRRSRNRSEFVVDAVRRELEWRRRSELRVSLENPHPESAELVEQELEEWSRGLPYEDAELLLNHQDGKAVRWIPGQGWVEDEA